MKTRLLLLLLCLLPLMAHAQRKAAPATDRAEVTLQTTQGKIVVQLYNEPENFAKLALTGYYDGLLFHRIIQSFMIQCGDSTSRNCPAQDFERSAGDDGVRLPAEIRYPELFHRRGTLCAAREGDEFNPERKSSPYEFYLSWGKYFTPRDMVAQQERVMEREDSTRHFTYTPEVIDAYEIDGGIPHLDNEYTVFGEVIKGLDVVGQIQAVKTDSLDRPLKDVRIKKAWVSREL